MLFTHSRRTVRRVDPTVGRRCGGRRRLRLRPIVRGGCRLRGWFGRHPVTGSGLLAGSPLAPGGNPGRCDPTRLATAGGAVSGRGARRHADHDVLCADLRLHVSVRTTGSGDTAGQQAGLVGWSAGDHDGRSDGWQLELRHDRGAARRGDAAAGPCSL